MPTPPLVPNVIRFRITGDLVNGAPWGVRLYAGYSGTAPTVGDILGLATSVGEAWGAHVLNLLSDGISLTACDAVDLSAIDGAADTAVLALAGSDGGNVLPNQAAVVIKFDIARRYRGGKPRMYLPGPTAERLLDPSHFTLDATEAFSGGMTDFAEAIIGLSEGTTTITTQCNVSLYSGFTSVENPITHRWRNVPTYRDDPIVDIIGGWVADALIGSQKRRRVG